SNQFLRGARFGSARQVRRALWRHARGSFAIGGVAVPESFEPEHILICGAPGTGKTNIIVKMLAGIREKRRRAIVYDTAGTFVEKFYRPGIDVMLNPLDVRSDRWSPWVDVPREYHYDQIAESTIPDKSGDPFWAKSARGTLVAVLRKLARQERMLVSQLLDTLVRSKLKDLAAFAQGTEAAAFI
ncbi:type IV secretion system DNA-binding domain-containing protein, partial [Pseudomonas aeruginosa]